jgi:hypothetical protein
LLLSFAIDADEDLSHPSMLTRRDSAVSGTQEILQLDEGTLMLFLPGRDLRVEAKPSM